LRRRLGIDAKFREERLSAKEADENARRSSRRTEKRRRRHSHVECLPFQAITQGNADTIRRVSIFTIAASEEDGMSPGAFMYGWSDDKQRFSGVVWPSVVAFLFAALSVISFAIDQSVTVSILPELTDFNARR
jgi:hypothetical protein